FLLARYTLSIEDELSTTPTLCSNTSSSQNQTTRLRSFTINICDFTQQGLKLNNKLTINATVRLIQETLKLKYDETCDRSVLTHIVKSSMIKLAAQRETNEENVKGEITLILSVQNIQKEKDNLKSKIQHHGKAFIDTSGRVFRAIKSKLNTDEKTISSTVEDKKKKKAGRRRMLKENELIMKIDISSFIEKDESLQDEEHILQLIKFVKTIVTDNNLAFSTITIEKQIRNQLSKLKYQHVQARKSRKQRTSLLWPTKIIAIKLASQNDEIPNSLNKTFIFSTDSTNIKDTNLNPLNHDEIDLHSFTLDDISCLTDHNEEELFIGKSVVTILSEDDIRVSIDYSILSYLRRDDTTFANFIRTIKSRLIDLSISEQRINWSSIQKSLIKRLSVVQLSEDTQTNKIITFAFKLVSMNEVNYF
ncbi:unnamed protein product, partial [Didymodactylos carnosus]